MSSQHENYERGSQRAQGQPAQQHPAQQHPAQQHPAQLPATPAASAQQQATYVPIDMSDTSLAQMQSERATTIAAGGTPRQLYVKVDPGPEQEFPKTVYNAGDRTSKTATDPKDQEKLEAQGYSATPPSPDPDQPDNQKPAKK